MTGRKGKGALWGRLLEPAPNGTFSIHVGRLWPTPKHWRAGMRADWNFLRSVCVRPSIQPPIFGKSVICLSRCHVKLHHRYIKTFVCLCLIPKGRPCASGRDMRGHKVTSVSDKLGMRKGWNNKCRSLRPHNSIVIARQWQKQLTPSLSTDLQLPLHCPSYYLLHHIHNRWLPSVTLFLIYLDWI